jgi:hypothetical protein
MPLDYTRLIKEWIVILRMIKAEDVTLPRLFNLCKEYNVNYKNCKKHYSVIYKMSYQGARNFTNMMIERYINMSYKEIIPPVPPLMTSYELEASKLLVSMKMCL